MSEQPQSKSFWKALGPGLLWAGAAVGVSHLVQSTRAGASFGFALLGVLVVANIFKYPAFSFGPRYAAATGTSLLEGYRRQGKWALVLYGLLTLGTMFTVQAVVTLVTAALLSALFGLKNAVVWLSAVLTIVCAGLLAIGHYKWLDKIVKVVVAILTVTTVLATILALPKIDWGSTTFVMSSDFFTDPPMILFLVAFVGWMPSAFDISIWHSLWTLARRRETGVAPSVKDALTDFNVGYLGTALLALCFVTLGAGVMYHSGEKFSNNAGVFANQVIGLYTSGIGEWAKPIIATAAFTVMFSTTLTVVDGFPRAIAALVSRFKEPEVPDHPTQFSRLVYWIALCVLGVGAVGIIWYAIGGGKAFKSLVDLATSLSFLSAAPLAYLNHRAVLGKEMPEDSRPGKAMIAYSWAGIAFCTVFALYYIYVLVS
ncbi:MAG: Nramp family divalent metal transporter [Planctomycetes bacterium]|nr:Nramp family divalent metal transporter [Planctomycetota bacterium]